MNRIADQKATARKQAFARRKAAHADYSGDQACENLLQYLQPHLGKPISGYMPIRTEIDPLPAMSELAKSGSVAVPVVLGAGQSLAFHRWQVDGDMQDGPFGARVPVAGEIVMPQVIILPLVAFDNQGQRLGYGGGFYDRTLEILRRKFPVLTVGFSYSAQQVDYLPTDPTDQPLNAVVTEAGIRLF